MGITRKFLTVILAYTQVVLAASIAVMAWQHYNPNRTAEMMESHDFYRRYYADYVSRKSVNSRIWEGRLDGPEPYMHGYSGGCVIYGHDLKRLMAWSSSAFVCPDEVSMCTELKVPEGWEVHCFPWAVDLEDRKFSDFSRHGMAIFRGGEKVYFTDYCKPGFWMFRVKTL